MHFPLFYMTPMYGSGTTVFTAHLFKALRLAGHDPMIYRIGRKTKPDPEYFGEYARVLSRVVTPEFALELAGDFPSLICAPGRNMPQDFIKKLLKCGARPVMHDPRQFGNYGKGYPPKIPVEPICVRESMLKFFPKGKFIPHPYERQVTKPPSLASRPWRAVSTTRIATMKRPRLILQANRLLTKKLRIKLMGSETGMCNFGLSRQYPDVYQLSGKKLQFPLSFTGATDILQKYVFNVDMSIIQDDGGGSQYAQLEALDAGTLNIMHEDWLNGAGRKAHDTTLYVHDVEQLATFVREIPIKHLLDKQKHGYHLLKKHDAATIGRAYAKELV